MNEEWKALILDHYKNPRHFGTPSHYTHSSEQHNRTCGDHVTVFAAMDKPEARFGFTGAGCSLSLASASLMLDLIQDKTRPEIEEIQAEFQTLWANGLPEGEARAAWKALEGLRAYPVRSRCVKLAWQALDEILSRPL